MKRFDLALALAFAACGGTSAPDATTPTGAGDADHEHGTGSGQPATPVETPADTPSAPDPAQVKVDLAAAEQAAYEKAKPVFDKYCARCHSKDSKKASAKALDHFEMTSYPFGGHHAMEVAAEVRKALAIGGGKATMPRDQKGAVQGDELALVAAWADAFDASHEGGAHEEADHDAHHDHGDHKH